MKCKKTRDRQNHKAEIISFRDVNVACMNELRTENGAAHYCCLYVGFAAVLNAHPVFNQAISEKFCTTQNIPVCAAARREAEHIAVFKLSSERRLWPV